MFLQNVWAENWNKSGRGFPAIEATKGAGAFVGRPVFFDRGNGAPNVGGDGVVATDFADLVCQN